MGYIEWLNVQIIFLQSTVTCMILNLFWKNEVDVQLNFPSPSLPPPPVHAISGSFSQPPRSTLSITGFVIQLRKHHLGTKINEGLMLTWCFLLFSARHQRTTPFSFSLRPVHNAKKKMKSCTMHKEDLQFDVYQMELKITCFHLSSYGYIEEYNRIWRVRVTGGTWSFRHLWN